MAVDDSLKRPAYAKRSLMELVAGVAPTSAPAEVATEVDATEAAEFQPPPKKADPLPQPGDAYRAHARFLSRLGSDQRMIHFVHGDFACDGFSYHDLRRVRIVPADQPGRGPTLILRFMEAVVTEVTIAGRNLIDLHYYISEGWMPWVWEQPRGFKMPDDHATVITSITFAELEK